DDVVVSVFSLADPVPRSRSQPDESALLREPALQQGRHVRVVLDDQDPHRASIDRPHEPWVKRSACFTNASSGLRSLPTAGDGRRQQEDTMKRHVVAAVGAAVMATLVAA